MLLYSLWLLVLLKFYSKYSIFFLSGNHLQKFFSLIIKMQTLETESHINLSFIENGERVRKSYFLESENGHYRLKSTKHKSKPGTNSTVTVLHIRVKYWKLYVKIVNKLWSNFWKSSLMNTLIAYTCNYTYTVKNQINFDIG